EGSGKADDAAVFAGGGHRAQGVVEVVRDARGFVDDDHVDVGVATDGGLAARQADDAAAVGEGQFMGDLFLDELGAEAAVKLGDAAKEFLGLAQAARQDEDKSAGNVRGLQQSE